MIAVINTFLLCIIKINSYHHAAKHAQACHTHTSGIYKSDMPLILLYHTFLMVVLLVVLRPYGSALIPSKKLLRNWARWPNLAQDLAQDPGQEFGRHNLGTLYKVLGKRWQVLGKSWASYCAIGQDGQILPRILPKILGKSLAAIILAPCTRSWARGGKSWASLGQVVVLRKNFLLTLF